MVILDQCGKSPQRKWLKFSQNAYLANTKGFSKYGVGLVSGLNNFVRAGVQYLNPLFCVGKATYSVNKASCFVGSATLVCVGRATLETGP